FVHIERGTGFFSCDGNNLSRPARWRAAVRSWARTASSGGTKVARVARNRPPLDCCTRPCRPRPSLADCRSQGRAALARAPSLLLELRRRNRACLWRLAARLPAMQGRAFSSHRSCCGNAGKGTRTFPARAFPSVLTDPLAFSFPVRLSGGVDRGCRPSGNSRGSGHHLRAGGLFCLTALAVSDITHDRLPCRGVNV